MGVLRCVAAGCRNGRFSDKRVEKLDVEVLTACGWQRINCCFLTESLDAPRCMRVWELVKRARKGSAAPFANAVLRKLAEYQGGQI